MCIERDAVLPLFMTESPKFARSRVRFYAYQLQQIHWRRLIFAVEHFFVILRG